ncbi:leucine-rich repeat protein [Tannerella forsythia]|uniref:T9SS C-terminal target domain-containing protein n=1 Tax=Tannerella forsythia TaxID=28112 RepID=A0A3P1XEY6_TANFO|nr:leucine-rich repeat protein [Tannerella forsythia]RRD56688.1 T9SS C-terminal target domain-containing protein [Tannerella forsythia]
MKRIKQISIWLIALAGLMTALGAAAQNSGNTGPLHWNYNAGTQTLTITGTGAMPDYALARDQPWMAFREQIKTVTIRKGVTAIGKSAFDCCTALQSITLPDGLTAIGKDAFESCRALQSITLPDGLTAIGEGAFSFCEALRSITLPDGVTKIEAKVFMGCYTLQSITLPDGVTEIGRSAFDKCLELKSITLPARLTAIGKYAFANCEALPYITLPDGVTTIEFAAFAACTALQSITLPARVTTIEAGAFCNCLALKSITLRGRVTTIGKEAFYGCKALQSITLPADLTEIEFGAFSGCTALQSITLPKGVTTIGKYAFSGCTALQQVTVAWDKPRSVPDNTFDGVHTANVRLNVPKGKEEAYRAAPVWKEFKIDDTKPPVPGNGGKLSIYTTHEIFDIDWKAATDNVTPKEQLKYTLFWKKASAGVWNRVNYPWDAVFHTITAEANTEYIVYVRVTDEAGNYADYKRTSFKTRPSPPPVPGNGGKLTVSNITGSGFTVNWEKAKDNKTPQNKLIYKVYRKMGGPIIFQSSDLVATLTNETSYTFKYLDSGIGINPALGYDVNVKVVDEDGSGAWYKTENVKLDPATFAVTGVTLDPGALTLKVDQTGALTATVAPATATNKRVTWTSSDMTVATVDDIGTVKGIAPGTAIITVTTADGGKTATCDVTVKEVIAVTGVTLSPTSLNLEVGQTGALTATVAPATATDKSLTWTSRNMTVATVDGSGTVEGIAPGTAIIEVKTVDGGKTATCAVTVKAAAAPVIAVTGVTLSPTSLNLEVGQTGALTATVAPATATNKKVTWTSSDTTIATVDGSGTVKGIAPGTATIAVKTVDGGKTARATVTVKAATAPTVKVTSVTLNHHTVTVNGDITRKQLTATVAPATATDKSLTWTSDNPEVASVDATGLVTIHKKGKARVTARANDGSGVSASCLFDVIRTVANETVEGLRIYAAGGALRLTLPKAETVHIYNVEGSLVKTLTLSAGDHVQPLPSGVYLVRVGEQVTKILVK